MIFVIEYWNSLQSVGKIDVLLPLFRELTIKIKDGQTILELLNEVSVIRANLFSFGKTIRYSSAEMNEFGIIAMCEYPL
jgi:hypothetical protein